MFEIIKADRGIAREHGVLAGGAGHWALVARLGHLKLSGPAVTVWMQLRGETRIECRDGAFRLAKGDWLVLDREAAAAVQAQRGAITIGLAVPGDKWDVLTGESEHAPVTGLASMGRADLRTTLRLWRQGVREQNEADRARRCLQILLLHLRSLQPETDALLQRCPGRSRHFKRHVLGRLQRARLFMEGNAHRIVRMSELAQLTNLSVWQFSKSFHAVYLEAPQTAALRVRLQRALHLLQTTSLTVTEVGWTCGFENCCSFSRAFRSHFSMTATEFRNRFSREAA